MKSFSNSSSSSPSLFLFLLSCWWLVQVAVVIIVQGQVCSNLNYLVNDPPADNVVGQIDFSSSVAAIAQNQFYTPTGIAFSNYTGGKIFVCGYQANRVLRFSADLPVTNASAEAVFGQLSFTTGTSSNSASGLRLINCLVSLFSSSLSFSLSLSTSFIVVCCSCWLRPFS